MMVSVRQFTYLELTSRCLMIRYASISYCSVAVKSLAVCTQQCLWTAHKYMHCHWVCQYHLCFVCDVVWLQELDVHNLT